MAIQLNGLKVAILVANGFEQSEMTEPRRALDEAGAKTTLISPEKSAVRGWRDGNWAAEFAVDVQLDVANAMQYDALLLPGGVMNPDKLRMIPAAIEFIKKFGAANKPIASICHGPWTLINAELVRGKAVTSWPSIKIDLLNAGARWVDAEAMTDGMLVTSRKPEDIPAFNTAMIELFAKR